jgi:polyphosphate kinase
MDANTYVNRELSWLEFNRRVLEEANDEAVPLLERVKFLSIFSSNLDEFFMVRVARLKRLVRESDVTAGPDGLTPAETLSAISKRAHQLAEEQHLCFLNTILPKLTSEGIHLIHPEEMSGEQERFLEDYFHRTLYPIVTPLAIDPGHPFPYLANRSLCLIFSLRATITSRLPHTDLSVVHIPTHVVHRFITLPARDGQHAFMLLEDVLRQYLPRLYHGLEILSCHAIRVSRDADFLIPRRRDEDLLGAIEQGIRERRMGAAVRLQYDTDLPMRIVGKLVEELELGVEDLYPGTGFTAFTDLIQLYASINAGRLKEKFVQRRLALFCLMCAQRRKLWS